MHFSLPGIALFEVWELNMEVKMIFLEKKGYLLRNYENSLGLDL